MTIQPAIKKRPRFIIILAAIAGICLACILASFAMESLGLLPDTPTQIQDAPLPVSTNTIIVLPTEATRCVPASALQMEFIRAGIKSEQESNDVLQGFAVRSNDYERVWFVAAEIIGPGIEPKQAIGLWSISGDLESPGLIYSANAFAIEFSGYGDGSKTDAQTSQFDDGAQDALTCVADR